MRSTHAALKWIVTLLEERDIPYEIDGGFAAKLYGTERDLADIDINVYEKDFNILIPLVKDYLVYGPENYKDNQWEILLMTVEYAGQKIDIGALETIKYFDSEDNVWVDFPSDLSKCRAMTYEGMVLPVINEVEFMIYKKKLGRGVDIKDVYGMEDALLGIDYTT